MKIYISGQITGDPNYKEKFLFYNEILRKKFPSVEIFNPAIEIEKEKYWNQWIWETYIVWGIFMLDGCDMIYMIPDWNQSQGAIIEREYAKIKGIAIEYFKTLYRKEK